MDLELLFLTPQSCRTLLLFLVLKCSNAQGREARGHLFLPVHQLELEGMCLEVFLFQQQVKPQRGAFLRNKARLLQPSAFAGHRSQERLEASILRFQ